MFGGTEPGFARFLWRLLGAAALLLGGIGIVLPLLPTTPFVILAAFAFGKGAPELANRLAESKTFGAIIVDWQRNGAIAPRYKLVATGMMSAVLLGSFVAGVSVVILGIQAIFIVGAGAFVLSRPNGPA